MNKYNCVIQNLIISNTPVKSFPTIQYVGIQHTVLLGKSIVAQ